MKNQRGITLTSLVIYVIVLAIVITMLAVIRNNFESNLGEMNNNASIEAEFNKFNLYFAQDMRKTGNEVSVSNDNKKVEFTLGNSYEYNEEDNCVYLTNQGQEIALLKNIDECTFTKDTTTGKTIIHVSIRFKGMDSQIEKDYVLGEDQEIAYYEDEEDYINRVKSGHTELEYIESTGTQYIDTGYVANGNSRFEYEFKFTDSTQRSVHLGGTDISGDVSASLGLGYIQPDGMVRYAMYWDSNTFGKIGIDTNYHSVIFNDENHVVKVDNVNLATFSKANLYSTQQDVYLFACNGKDGAMQGSKAILKYMKIYDNNTLVRDFIPVLDKNGVACLYDKVEKKYYYNQGTGDDFVPGPEKYTELEYIESTGTQYIDTGYVANGNSRFEYEFKFNESGGYFGGTNTINVNEAGIGLGSYYSSNNTIMFHMSWANLTNINYDTNYHKVIFNNSNHQLIVDNSNLVTFSSANQYSTSQSIYLFAINNTGNVAGYFSSSSLKYMKIYDNNTLVRDFIPVLDSENKACLYDKVEEKYYYNQGTGDFIAGPEI